MADDINFVFKKELTEHGKFLTEALRKRLEEMKLIKTGDLLKSIDYNVVESGSVATLQVNFNTYGRAFEIRFYRSQNSLKHNTETRQNREKLKDKKTKDARWYSKTAYGTVKRLRVNLLLGEFPDQVKQQVQNQIQKYYA